MQIPGLNLLNATDSEVRAIEDQHHHEARQNIFREGKPEDDEADSAPPTDQEKHDPEKTTTEKQIPSNDDDFVEQHPVADFKVDPLEIALAAESRQPILEHDAKVASSTGTEE